MSRRRTRSREFGGATALLLVLIAGVLVSVFAWSTRDRSRIPRAPVPMLYGHSAYGVSARSPVACPEDQPGVLVIFILGQSNAGNSVRPPGVGGHIGQGVYEYFEGRCYRATHSVLGAEGSDAAIWPILGTRMVEQRIASQVVFAVVAINGAPIRRFLDPADLLPIWTRQWRQLHAAYSVDAVLWMQGEADFALGTSSARYSEAFRQLLSAIRDTEDRHAPPVFVPVLTRCTGKRDWSADNPTATAQRSIAAQLNGPHSILDLDAVLNFPTARHDGCHLSESGVQAATAAWLATLTLAGVAR